MNTKEYVKPEVVIVITPASLMKGDGSGNLTIASQPYPGHGEAPTSAKQFAGMSSWDDEEDELDDEILSKSSSAWEK